MRMHHSGGVEIECEMATFSLDDQPLHTALSYCWTKQPASCEIRINGKHYLVRPNLYAFLQVMRKEGDPCWIFIDAICINQDDPTERSSQVALMGAVYREAKEVVAWMSNESQFEDETLSSMQPICDKEEAIVRMAEWCAKPNATERNAFGIFLLCFLKSDYWNRLWVVQEIMLARRLIMRHRGLSVKVELLQISPLNKLLSFSLTVF